MSLAHHTTSTDLTCVDAQCVVYKSLIHGLVDCLERRLVVDG